LKAHLLIKEEKFMPEKRVVEKAKKDMRKGRSASTAAGEFVRNEIHHVREGKHGARSPKQAIAIGLSEARRAGVPLKPPKRGKSSEATRAKAEREYEKGQHEPKRHAESNSPRSRARSRALKRESKHTASHSALSRPAKSAARRRRGRGRGALGADFHQLSAFNISDRAPSAKAAKHSARRSARP
jgi:hypothetical protein